MDRSQASRLFTGARGFQGRGRSQALGAATVSTTPEQAHLVALAEEARRTGMVAAVRSPCVSPHDDRHGAGGSVDRRVRRQRDAGTASDARVRRSRGRCCLGAIDVPHQRIADIVKVRMRRQQILSRTRAPELWVVIDEAVLARVGGGVAVMRNQLEHLHAKANEPGITVQVVGVRVRPIRGRRSLHPPADGGRSSGRALQGVPSRDRTTPPITLSCRPRGNLWDRLRALALSPRESTELIMRYIDRLLQS